MFMAENCLKIKKGKSESVVERFKNRQGIDTIEGFKDMLVTVTNETEDYDEVKILTIWQSKDAFKNWLHSDAFKEAHQKARNNKGNEESPIINNKVTTYTIAYKYDE
ncbi:antibiotic biosynthesis monooxygenase [Staphylococcus chromogenes]|uniref:antibiotic biosynthesis monooxygenase n=1 Tax=Staphylococcus chromogenes TaxID=46126 RepID=UPI002888CB2E|nr:antibiotic biosynthesis monooxygenase [Staphylococcus chromogenes]MDT0698534.1 antibiotic biosynthesis monooxygenase [Staphylococcus chromogenes]